MKQNCKVVLKIKEGLGSTADASLSKKYNELQKHKSLKLNVISVNLSVRFVLPNQSWALFTNKT